MSMSSSSRRISKREHIRRVRRAHWYATLTRAQRAGIIRRQEAERKEEVKNGIILFSVLFGMIGVMWLITTIWPPAAK